MTHYSNSSPWCVSLPWQLSFSGAALIHKSCLADQKIKLVKKKSFDFNVRTAAGGCFTRSTSPDLQPAATWYHHPALCPLKHNGKLKLSGCPSRTEQTRPASSWWINKKDFWLWIEKPHFKFKNVLIHSWNNYYIYFLNYFWDHF